MSDKIIGIEETTSKDRAELNVGGRKFNNKILVLVGVAFIAFLIICTGVYFAMKNASSDTLEKGVIIEDNSYIGSEDSSLDDSNNFFEALKNKKDRDDQLEITRQKRELELLEIEEAKKEKQQERKNTKLQRTKGGEPYKPNVSIEPKKVERSYSTASTNIKPQVNPENTPAMRKARGSVVVGGTSSRASSGAPENFSQNFNASKFSNGSASLREKGSLDFLLGHGSSLPCALKTQIISDYEGYVTCQIIQDIYSVNGATLLVEKGSVVSGTQSVSLETGKERVFTSWGDIETPLGVSIRIDSLGSGRLGAAGIDAWVDKHYQERFGGAILLSFVDDALNALSEKIANKETASVDNSTQNASDMASKVLEASINIKDTGYAFIGQRINILVARDIDMSNIYHFEK